MKDNLKISDFMSRNPVCITEETSLEEIFYLLHIKPVSHLLVVKEWKIVGIISNGDIIDQLKKLNYQTSGKVFTDYAIKHIRAEDVMHKDPICLKSTDSIDNALELFLQQKIHSLPVIDEQEKPIGIVTPTDLLRAYSQKM